MGGMVGSLVPVVSGAVVGEVDKFVEGQEGAECEGEEDVWCHVRGQEVAALRPGEFGASELAAGGLRGSATLGQLGSR